MLQVVNIPNSMTVLPELLPYSIEMVRHCTLSCCLVHPAPDDRNATCFNADKGHFYTGKPAEGLAIALRQDRLHQVLQLSII